MLLPPPSAAKSEWFHLKRSCSLTANVCNNRASNSRGCMKAPRPVTLLVLLLSFAAHSQSSTDSIKLEKEQIRGSDLSQFIEGKTVVSEIEFTGLDIDFEEYGVFIENPLYETRLRRAFEPSDLVEGQPFSTSKTEIVLKKAKDWLLAHGFPLAEVKAYGTRLSDGRMRLRFAVQRGPFIGTLNIDFVGNEHLSDQELLEDFKECTGDGWEVYEQRKFNHYSQRCSRQLMFSKGFWRAKILGVSSRLTRAGRNVTIRLEEGVRYRIGEVKIEGAIVFPEWEIRESLGLKTGDIADGKKLNKFVFENLKRRYGEKGFVNCIGEFEPDFVEPQTVGVDGKVNIHLTIDEGKQFRLHRVSFLGLSQTEGENLKGAFPLSLGDVYIPSKIALWIETLNKSGRFFPLNKDQHVEVRTDDEDGTLDLAILLKKITP